MQSTRPDGVPDRLGRRSNGGRRVSRRWRRRGGRTGGRSDGGGKRWGRRENETPRWVRALDCRGMWGWGSESVQDLLEASGSL